jgi:hypothetical protein
MRPSAASVTRWFAFSMALALGSMLLPSSLARGDGSPPRPAAPKAPPPAKVAEAWSAVDARITADLGQGKPFVVVVIVPLCDNEQIDCGSPIAGRPRDLAHNVYWGAAFGHRRFFERKGSGWTRVELAPARGEILERAVYRRRISRAPWGGAADETAEQIVVLEAIDGAQIDQAVKRFWGLATGGGQVRWKDGEAAREERIHAVGYAGHNRMMDGLKFPAAALPGPTRKPIPSFVMACSSEPYFSPSLRLAGSEPIVMTRSLMAPEGYVVDAIARALGENLPRGEVRARAALAYAHWQRLSSRAASSVFAKLP